MHKPNPNVAGLEALTLLCRIEPDHTSFPTSTRQMRILHWVAESFM
ncbi:hypothetical protein HNQ96_002197 [Aminobacter lissarensis]|uniref:Uncharacterized protein n=1 Tax=Aminobacter carboxidus TaxID=376165 RepID=A0A8E1WFC4_9HYPH|nr:hypothetical protein [Aminobacter lissarensis]